MTPAGTSNELDVQNGWEENTTTYIIYCIPQFLFRQNIARNIGGKEDTDGVGVPVISTSSEILGTKRTYSQVLTFSGPVACGS